MRIDKFLKNSRLIKRRTVAKDACDQERVSVNGKIVKAGAEVKEGDVILMHDGYRSSVDAAFALVDHLQKQGFVFVNVEEMILE